MKLMFTHLVDELPVSFLDGGVKEIETLQGSRIREDVLIIASLLNILVDHGVDRIEALTDLFVEGVGWRGPFGTTGDRDVDLVSGRCKEETPIPGSATSASRPFELAEEWVENWFGAASQKIEHELPLGFERGS